jgi:hypothetical protein
VDIAKRQDILASVLGILAAACSYSHVSYSHVLYLTRHDSNEFANCQKPHLDRADEEADKKAGEKAGFAGLLSLELLWRHISTCLEISK